MLVRIQTRVLVTAWLAAMLLLGCASDNPASSSGASAGSGGQPSGGASGQTAGGIGGISAAGTGSGGMSSGGGGMTGGSGGGGGMSSGIGGMTAGDSGIVDAGDMTADSGVGDAGGNPATPSTGCSMTTSQALASWVEQPRLHVDDDDRQWWIWLPEGYDPARAYPLVFTFHGCGGPDNFLPIQRATGGDAIVVRGTGITGGCWTYGGDDHDVAFFDAMLEDIGERFCIDTSRVFATGYSSGAWLVNTLSCARGDKLRATSSVSGGVVDNRGTCVGEYARIFLHDADDTTNKFVEAGNEEELARVLEQNHCMADAPAVAEDPEPCARYQGCDDDYPVILCKTQGEGHDRQDDLAIEAFWKLFSSL